MRGSARSARAIEISWRSPAERPEPPSRTVVLEPAREPRRDAVDADRRRGRRDLLVGRVGLREADVRRDRAAEEERILQDDAELAAVRAQLHFAEVDAVDAHRALVGVVEAADEARERRLAAAGLADEGETAARRHVDVDAVQHRLRAVGEDDVVDLEIALDPRQLVRVRRSWMSGSSSRTVAILTIAAAPDCSWP